MSGAEQSSLSAEGEPDYDVVFLDLETTGLSPRTCDIIEIGAIKMCEADLLGEHTRTTAAVILFQKFVIPPGAIPTRITALTGITDAMIQAEGVPLADAMAALHAFVGDLRIVAYNAPFDRGFIEASASQTGHKFNNEWLCAYQIAKSTWPDLPSHKLADLAANVDAGDAHRALADCKRTIHVIYRALRA